MPPLLQVRNLAHYYGGAKSLPAVVGVNLDVEEGETLGIVGLSGSGKSTLARAIVQCPRPSFGSVLFKGQDLATLSGQRLRAAREGIQFVFQDPYASLNGQWTVAKIVGEPLRILGVLAPEPLARRTDELLELVELDPEVYRSRRPRELSSGQCQRVALARAISSDPALLICDEALSALDAIIQSQMLKLMAEIRRQRKFSCIFISHDIGIVAMVSDRVATMYQGRICELSPTTTMLRDAQHFHTKELVLADRRLSDPSGRASR